MKHQEIRRVVFITDAADLNQQSDFLDYLKQNKGTLLSSHKCDEGFVCLVHQEDQFVELPSNG